MIDSYMERQEILGSEPKARTQGSNESDGFEKVRHEDAYFEEIQHEKKLEQSINAFQDMAQDSVYPLMTTDPTK